MQSHAVRINRLFHVIMVNLRTRTVGRVCDKRVTPVVAGLSHNCWKFYLVALPSFLMTLLADALLSVLPTDILPRYLERWIVGETPLSTWPVVTTALASYLAIIFGIQELMRDRPPQQLNTLFRIHNAFLSVGSLVLLALMIEEVASIWFSSDVFSVVCAAQSWTPVRSLEFASCYF